MKLLIKNGEDPEIRDNGGLYTLFLACEKSREEIELIKFLYHRIERNADELVSSQRYDKARLVDLCLFYCCVADRSPSSSFDIFQFFFPK